MVLMWANLEACNVAIFLGGQSRFGHHNGNFFQRGGSLNIIFSSEF